MYLLKIPKSAGNVYSEPGWLFDRYTTMCKKKLLRFHFRLNDLIYHKKTLVMLRIKYKKPVSLESWTNQTTIGTADVFSLWETAVPNLK